jgi:16S rRNA (uracil1498-N3)-methyltransferase
VVERHDRAALATFYVDGSLVADAIVRLDENAAHHARVRRLVAGERVRLTNGVGTQASAELTAVNRSALAARVLDTESVPQPTAIHLRAPVADRDRMLWLAEKATELGIASWQAVRFRRSAGVSPRGEGAAFTGRLRARMIGALEQSSGGWMPSILPDVEPSALDLPNGVMGLVLDRTGAALLPALAGRRGDVAIVLGPEGGMEPEELGLLVARGWRSVRLTATTLRFETAAIAAIAIARATTVTEDA